MNGATLWSTAYCNAFQTLLVRLWHLSGDTRPAKMQMICAFLAAPPDHSMSRSDSASAPEQGADVDVLGTTVMVTVLAGKPAALRNLLRSVVLTVLCPTTAIFCPVPSAPAEYKGL